MIIFKLFKFVKLKLLNISILIVFQICMNMQKISTFKNLFLLLLIKLNYIYLNLPLHSNMKNKYLKPLKIADFDNIVTLGKGLFGKVKLVQNKINQKYFALKILNKAQIIKSNQVDHIFNESKILMIIDHPFIVNIEGFTQDSKYLYLLLEYVPGGQLFSYLRSCDHFTAPHSAVYAAQVVQIFQYLHSKNIIYRDLKPQNLLIAQDGYLKLTDFRYAKVIDGRTYTLCGTPQYLAPEVLLNRGHGKPVDWWTLGVLIYQMNAGIDPFSDQEPLKIYQSILQCKVKYPKQFDKETKAICKNLLVLDISKRFGNLKNGTLDIKQLQFFSHINWKNLLNKKEKVFYQPLLKNPGDFRNFDAYPDSSGQNLTQSIKFNYDPFQQEWQY